MNKLGLTFKHETIISKILQNYPHVEYAKIFGSRAKGNYNERSDIDIVVYGDKINRHEIASILLDLQSSDLPYLVDLQNYNDINNFALRQHIDNWGEIFYKQK